jgi:hypothetical protein
MTAPAPSLVVAPAAARVPLRRVLGAVGMLASPAFFAQWLASGPFGPSAAAQHAPSISGNLFDLAYLTGFAASAVGLRRLRATGRGRGAAALFVVQVAGLCLAATQDLQDLTKVRPLGDAFYAASDMAWPLSHLFMVAVFAAVWRARVWTGWRRWAPLACGLVLPLALAASAAAGARPWAPSSAPGRRSRSSRSASRCAPHRRPAWRRNRWDPEL